MMLARLGLRANEVATLTLDDIDWRSGEMLVRAKGRQQARMPMPSDGRLVNGWPQVRIDELIPWCWAAPKAGAWGAAAMQPRGAVRCRRARAAAAPTSSASGFASRVYREIEIPSERSLCDLVAAIVGAFDFDLDYALGFFSKLDRHVFDSPVRYGVFADLEGGSESGSVKRTKVAQVFPTVGTTMQFLFDYGDDWRFQVGVIGLGEKAPQAGYSKLLKAIKALP